MAVGDLNGSVYNPNGLNISKLSNYVGKRGTVKGFPGGDAIDGKEMLELECDVLVPAAAGTQITEDNASQIKAKCIAEGTNSPTTPEAGEILLEKGVFVIPDILCNAGGVFLSYLEFAQKTQQEQMRRGEVKDRLQERMKDKFQEV